MNNIKPTHMKFVFSSQFEDAMQTIKTKTHIPDFKSGSNQGFVFQKNQMGLMPSVSSEMLTFGYDIISRGKQKIKCSKFQAFETWLIIYIYMYVCMYIYIYIFIFGGFTP